MKRFLVSPIVLVTLLVCVATPLTYAAKQKAAGGPNLSTANCYGHYPTGIFRYGNTTTNYTVDVHLALAYGKSAHPELFDDANEYFIAAMNAVNPAIQYQQANGVQPYIIIRVVLKRNATEDRYGLQVMVYGPHSIDASGAKYDPPFSTKNMRQWFWNEQDLVYLASLKMMTDAGTQVGQNLSNGWSCNNPDRP
jgi:hypothetical protein